MMNAIMSSLVVAVLNWLKNYLEGKHASIQLSNEAITKLHEVYKTIDQKSKDALEAINKPIDPTLPKKEREKLSEQAADDFFNKLR